MAGLLIEDESARPTHDFISENPLTDEEMFFHGKESVETGLQRNERAERFVDVRGGVEVARLERFPERDDCGDEIGPRHRAANPAVVGVDQGDPARALEDAGAPTRRIAQGRETRPDR